MREEYDFSDAMKNPYTKDKKKRITIKVEPYIIEYFKKESVEIGLPYQTLISLYLSDCAKHKRKLDIK